MKKIKNRERNILKRFFVNEKEDERIDVWLSKAIRKFGRKNSRSGSLYFGGLEKMTVIYMPKQSNGTEQFIT